MKESGYPTPLPTLVKKPCWIPGSSSTDLDNDSTIKTNCGSQKICQKSNFRQADIPSLSL